VKQLERLAAKAEKEQKVQEGKVKKVTHNETRMHFLTHTINPSLIAALWRYVWDTGAAKHMTIFSLNMVM